MYLCWRTETEGAEQTNDIYQSNTTAKQRLQLNQQTQRKAVKNVIIQAIYSVEYLHMLYNLE